ncbi:hypothetical protein CXB51_005002 [Gossypium anomalum]|uniref:Uncharacterized protein n=1 Tax=Gossypium anomalum TaxID=47600 RepID=A0A8J6D867_9ROSI|nr:hypothetical protein CXB51_005002 [Gossypium anomalum]
MKLSTHCWDNFLLQTCWKMTAWKKRRGGSVVSLFVKQGILAFKLWRISHIDSVKQAELVKLVNCCHTLACSGHVDCTNEQRQ